MPSRPPDSQFYEATDTHVLWRDLTRLYEDFCGEDPSQWPAKKERFKVVMHDTLALLEQAKAA